MGDWRLWSAFVVLFVVAGLLNLFRGLRRTDARRPVSITLSLSSFAWAASAGLYRFVAPNAGYIMAFLAAALMLWAALAGMRAGAQ